MNLSEVFAEIEAALPKVAWLPLKSELPIAESFRGDAEGWTFLIVTWTVTAREERHRLRADGTATKGGVIMRLTPELAKLARELACPCGEATTNE